MGSMERETWESAPPGTPIMTWASHSHSFIGGLLCYLLKNKHLRATRQRGKWRPRAWKVRRLSDAGSCGCGTSLSWVHHQSGPEFTCSTPRSLFFARLPQSLLCCIQSSLWSCHGVNWLLGFKENVKLVEEPLSGFGQSVVYFLALLQDFLFLQKFFPHLISSGVLGTHSNLSATTEHPCFARFSFFPRVLSTER